MSEPHWLSAELVIAFHGEQLREFGGPPGIRDRGMLESALGRPLNKWSYGEHDLAVLAASYGYGIAKNHPFVDGNKRAALLSIITFLGLNGVDFVVSNAEAVVMIQGLAAVEIEEEGLARWIRDNWPTQAVEAKPTSATGKAAPRSTLAAKSKPPASSKTKGSPKRLR